MKLSCWFLIALKKGNPMLGVIKKRTKNKNATVAILLHKYVVGKHLDHNYSSVTALEKLLR